MLEIGENLIFAGMFRWKDCGLYDVKEHLRKLLRISDEFGFPGKADARKEAEEIAGRPFFSSRGTGMRSFRKPGAKRSR